MDANRVALVTGGARRIGKAIVADLATHGYSVVIHAHRAVDEAAALAASITKQGGRAAAIVADLTDPAALDGVIGSASAAFGPPTLLVNSASIFEPDEATDFDWDLWDRHFAIHLKAPVMLARRFAAALPDDMSGLVVNIIDQRVLRPNPKFFSYTLSKFSVWDATRTLAQALAPRVRVNGIGPGPTLPNDRQQQRDFDKQVDGLILKRGPTLGEFGATIRYLDNTPSITGQMIALDGGQHLAWQTPDVTGMRE